MPASVGKQPGKQPGKQLLKQPGKHNTVQTLTIHDKSNLRESIKKAAKDAQVILNDPHMVAKIYAAEAADREKMARKSPQGAHAARAGISLSDLPETPEQLEKSLLNYIVTNNRALIQALINHGSIKIEGGWIESSLSRQHINKLSYLAASDITILPSIGKNTALKDITIDNVPDKLFMQDIEVKGRVYRAIRIPQTLREKKLGETETGKRLLEKKSLSRFVNIDFDTSIQTLLGDRIIREKTSRKGANGKPYVNIPTYDISAGTDVLRECLKEGVKPTSIVQNMVLGEIIKYGLGQKYIDFSTYKSDHALYKKVRKKIAIIDEYLGMHFGEYTASGHLIYNGGLYIDTQGNLKAFISGGSEIFGYLGGIVSIYLNWGTGTHAVDIHSFRSSL